MIEALHSPDALDGREFNCQGARASITKTPHAAITSFTWQFTRAAGKAKLADFFKHSWDTFL